MDHIAYKAGYKYQLVEDYQILTPVIPDHPIFMGWYSLDLEGLLYVSAGYAWDGASGPTLDTPASMRPSLVHDCLCQMMKERWLDYAKWNKIVHAYFRALCIEDGMSGPRAAIWHAGVLIGQGGNPDIQDENVVLVAPR